MLEITMSEYVHPILRDLPTEPETATRPFPPLAAEALQYPVGLLGELERMKDLRERAEQLLACDIWGIGPRTNALLQSVAEVGMLGLFLKSRVGQAKPPAEPRKQRPRQPGQHKQRAPVPAQRPLINILQEMLPSVGQPGGTAAGSGPA